MGAGTASRKRNIVVGAGRDLNKKTSINFYESQGLQARNKTQKEEEAPQCEMVDSHKPDKRLWSSGSLPVLSQLSILPASLIKRLYQQAGISSYFLFPQKPYGAALD